MMPDALSERMLGLPRWAWIAIVTTGVGIGLYMRRRRQAGEEMNEAMTDELVGEAGYIPGDDLAYSAEPGLAGVGVVAPPAGSVTPVQTPFIPEGFMDVFGGLGGTVGELGNVLGGVAMGAQDLAGTSIAYMPDAFNALTEIVTTSPAWNNPTEALTPVAIPPAMTGGGPPKAPPPKKAPPPPPKKANPTPGTGQEGILGRVTIYGRTFYNVKRNGKAYQKAGTRGPDDKGRRYEVWLIEHPGKTARWHYYLNDRSWRGPF